MSLLEEHAKTGRILKYFQGLYDEGFNNCTYVRDSVNFYKNRYLIQKTEVDKIMKERGFRK